MVRSRAFDPRELASAIFEEAVKAGDVGTLLPDLLRLDGDRLAVQGCTFDLSRNHRILVIGGGKASGAMAESIEAILGDRITDGVVVGKAGGPSRTRRGRVGRGGGPGPGG